jgi:hypothetical protein
MNRRSFLTNSAALLGGLGLATIPALAETNAIRKRVLRVAHLTDIHVMPDMTGFDHPELGMAEAIRHAQNQSDKPDMIFFGGDMVMDSLKTEKDKVLVQWGIWDKIFKEEVKIPYKLAIGNHDVWGWALHDNPDIENDPDYGKGLVKRHLGLENTYYSFDKAGWHFIFIDSLERDHGSKHGYTARIDDKQFAWLEKDLKSVPTATPICVLSHVPLLSVCTFFDGFDDLESTGSWVIPGAWTHIDAKRIKNLFSKHSNVKFCMSGHVHLCDDITYLGVRYCCNGAVSGGWWKGPYQEFGPAYALVDFFEDGTVENKLVYYRS